MYTSKENRKDCMLTFYCTKSERRYIDVSAKKAGCSRFKYLGHILLRGYVDKVRTLPPEVLAFQGQLMHLAGILFPISKKRLDGEDLNALERAEVKQAIRELEELYSQIKNHFT